MCLAKKDTKTYTLLGYNNIDLKNHIKKHPDWSNISGNYHVDHIFPIKAFIEHGIFDPSLINCLDNLRPMKPDDNLHKQGTYDKDEFRKWLLLRGAV